MYGEAENKNVLKTNRRQSKITTLIYNNYM